ncbi:response regulator [Halomonas sp. McH1-25]|uniref:response regulator n=1 Tax=unclassified Halomonas TaxID=2609666 RepID=UPI001EF70BEE|nr:MULTISPECIES: response regulator [unclassified Halomonas]MCG7601105.1 response regulator [Halomonas sp. McH1-25]MCP1342975.1 response regulator [Halomonas sp. FL8]MCP1360827.1 response regulator [Halomonas sp. BBD45]
MSKNIMIVDDSATMLMSLRSSLEMSGFRVEAATDGMQAMDRLKGGYKPDLIITDINMPNMGGLELIGKARALPGMRFTPILALTTESQQEKRDEAKRNGATGWLVKPINSADLLGVIKQVLPGV